MSKISIIVPIYNVAAYLDECVSSLLNQSYKNLEIILVNDGSTDNSLEICQKYEEIDKRVITINQINQGHGPALNNGMAKASGEFVMFCDGDDYYFPRMTERLYEAITLTKADIATCTAYAFDDLTKEVSIDPYHTLIQIPYQKPDDCLHRDQIYTYAGKLALQYWAKIYKISWLRQNRIQFPDVKMSYDDQAFHWHVLAVASSIALVREQLYAYRLNRPGASYTRIKQQEYLQSYKQAETLLQLHEPRLLDAFYQFYISDLWWLISQVRLEPTIDDEISQWLHQLSRKSIISLETKDLISQFISRNSLNVRMRKQVKRLLFRN